MRSHYTTSTREDVKEIIASARKQAGLSRKQAAELCGISWRTFESLEQGRFVPQGLYRQELERKLNLSLP